MALIIKVFVYSPLINRERKIILLAIVTGFSGIRFIYDMDCGKACKGDESLGRHDIWESLVPGCVEVFGN